MRSLRWSRVGAPLALLLASCGSEPRVPTAEGDPLGQVSVWMEAESLSADARFVGTLSPTVDAFMRGGYRLTLSDDGRVEWAADRFASTIVVAAQGARGWVFAGADGAVLRADTFLGPLTRIGNLREPVVASFAGRGTVAAITKRGEVFTSDGARPITRSVLPGDSRALAGAFATEAHGAVITEGGGLLATGDGGATWTEVALGNEAAWRFDLSGETLVVTTTAGIHVVAADGTLSDVPAHLTSDTGSSLLPPASFHREISGRFLGARDDLAVSLSKWSRFPESAFFRTEVLVAKDGRALMSDVGELVAFQLKTGERRAPPRAWLPQSRGCNLLRWGERSVLDCDEEAGNWPLQVGSHGSTFEPLPGTLARDPFDLAFSDDGEHAAWLGSCAATEKQPERAEPRRSLCAYRLHGPSRELPLDFPADGVVSIRGAKALVSGVGPDESALFALLDLESGASARLATAGMSIATLDFAGPTHLAGLGTLDGADDRWVLLRAGLDGRFEARPLPEDAESVGFLDAGRGVAVGTVLSQLWFTNDGGASWSVAPPAVSGASAQLALGWRGAPKVECEGNACRVGPASVRWGGSSTPGRTFANELTFDPGDEDDPMDPVVALREGCDLRTDAAPLHPGLPPVTSATARVETLDVGARSARWVEDAGLSTLTWRAELADAAMLESIPTALGDAPEHEPAMELVAADRRFALVTRCTSHPVDRCDILRAEPGKPLRVLAQLDAFASPANRQERPASFIAPDGSAVVLFAGDPNGESDGVVMPKLDVMIAFRPDGTVRERRGFAWTAGARMLSGLTVRGGAVGYFALGPATGGHVRYFGPATTSDAPPLAALDGPLPTCVGEPGGDRMIMPLRSRPAGLGLDGVSVGVLTVEISAAGSCARSFDTTSRYASSEDPAGPEANHVVARGGAWEASISRRDGLHVGQCVKPSP